MTFKEVRNAVVAGLEAHLGCPVILSEQIADKPAPPYCYYSTLTPRSSNHAFGLKGVTETEDGATVSRSEPVKATMSFTCCSENRETDDGYIFGDDEALELADKAHGFFLLNGHCIMTDAGDIVVDRVGRVGGRSSFIVEDTVRKYGFDVRLSYIRTDEMPAETIARAPIIGDAHS